MSRDTNPVHSVFQNSFVVMSHDLLLLGCALRKIRLNMVDCETWNLFIKNISVALPQATVEGTQATWPRFRGKNGLGFRYPRTNT